MIKSSRNASLLHFVFGETIGLWINRILCLCEFVVSKLNLPYFSAQIVTWHFIVLIFQKLVRLISRVPKNKVTEENSYSSLKLIYLVKTWKLYFINSIKHWNLYGGKVWKLLNFSYSIFIWFDSVESEKLAFWLRQFC